MTLQQAVQFLKDTRCTDERPFGAFVVKRIPQIIGGCSVEDFDSFVTAVKTLGAWSTGVNRKVEITSGVFGDEIIFKLTEQI